MIAMSMSLSGRAVPLAREPKTVRLLIIGFSSAHFASFRHASSSSWLLSLLGIERGRRLISSQAGPLTSARFREGFSRFRASPSTRTSEPSSAALYSVTAPLFLAIIRLIALSRRFQWPHVLCVLIHYFPKFWRHFLSRPMRFCISSVEARSRSQQNAISPQDIQSCALSWGPKGRFSRISRQCSGTPEALAVEAFTHV
jgi:hypothetical protein